VSGDDPDSVQRVKRETLSYFLPDEKRGVRSPVRRFGERCFVRKGEAQLEVLG
jgi:hypothetical protein